MIKKGIYIASILLAIVLIIISINIAKANGLVGLDNRRVSNLAGLDKKLVDPKPAEAKELGGGDLGLLRDVSKEVGNVLGKAEGVLSVEVLRTPNSFREGLHLA